jgi:hypothetical protein
VVALDLEGVGELGRAVYGDLDLAGGVGLYPDGGVRGADVAQERAEDKVWSHARVFTRTRSSHTKPTSRAMTGIRSTIRIRPMMSKKMPERTILVIGIIPEP